MTTRALVPRWLVLLGALPACAGGDLRPEPHAGPVGTWPSGWLTATMPPDAGPGDAAAPLPPLPPPSSTAEEEEPPAPEPLPPPPDKLRGTVTLTKSTWSLTASIHPSLPPFTFSVTGNVLLPPTGTNFVKDYAVKVVNVSEKPAPSYGPKAIFVSAGGKPLQRLERRPAPGFIDDALLNLELAITPIAGVGPGSVQASYLELLDLNGDGYLDLAVACSMAPKWFNYQFWLYSPAQHRFVESKELGRVRGLTPHHGKLVAVYPGEDPVLIEIWGFDGAGFHVMRGHKIYWSHDPHGVETPKGKAYVIDDEMRAGKPFVTREGLVPYNDVDEE